MHPALSPVAGLVGTFEGDGEGHYPTISPFRYRERVVFAEQGRPFLTYQQHTWHPDTDAPMHTEAGYLRVTGPGAADGGLSGTSRVEFLVAQPTGIVEVEEGTLADGVLTLATTTLGRTATAKDVWSVRRTFALRDDLLVYDLWMAYAHVPDTHHLHAELRRTD
jgi:hypothetical protein